MSTITIFIVALAVFFTLLYQVLKRIALSMLQKSLSKQDYATVITVADMGLNRRLLKDYLCDLYKLRAYYLDKNEDEFDKQLDHMIQQKGYKLEDKKDFLTNYFHTFLIKENKKYANKLLKGIQLIGDSDFSIYNEQAYEVIFEKRTDLIDTMVDEINSKKYYGFPLGVIVYTIARQYLYLNDMEHALIYFQNALVCFHPKSIYVPVINDYIKELQAQEKST